MFFSTQQPLYACIGKAIGTIKLMSGTLIVMTKLTIWLSFQRN